MTTQATVTHIKDLMDRDPEARHRITNEILRDALRGLPVTRSVMSLERRNLTLNTPR